MSNADVYQYALTSESLCGEVLNLNNHGLQQLSRRTDSSP